MFSLTTSFFKELLKGVFAKNERGIGLQRIFRRIRVQLIFHNICYLFYCNFVSPGAYTLFHFSRTLHLKKDFFNYCNRIIS